MTDNPRIGTPLHFARRLLARRRSQRDAARVAATEAHQRVALEVVRDVAAGPLERRSAHLVIDNAADQFYGVPAYRLIPRNPAASPVEVHADWNGTYLHVGHGRWVYELWQHDVEDRRRLLSACVAAVVAGCYSETLEPWKDGSRLTMTFQTPEGPVEVRHDHSTRLGDQPFGTTTYEPYESEAGT